MVKMTKWFRCWTENHLEVQHQHHNCGIEQLSLQSNTTKPGNYKAHHWWAEGLNSNCLLRQALQGIFCHLTSLFLNAIQGRLGNSKSGQPRAMASNGCSMLRVSCSIAVAWLLKLLVSLSWHWSLLLAVDMSPNSGTTKPSPVRTNGSCANNINPTTHSSKVKNCHIGSRSSTRCPHGHGLQQDAVHSTLSTGQDSPKSTSMSYEQPSLE